MRRLLIAAALAAGIVCLVTTRETPLPDRVRGAGW